MTDPHIDNAIARCACGSVELQLSGPPILCVACCCDDCQEGGRQIERLPDAPPVLGPGGETAYMVYRKDRMECSKGAEHLNDYRLHQASPTRRVVAVCCNSAMFADFQKGHWFSVYRARFTGDVPALQMRVQTKFRPADTVASDDVPDYAGYPVKFIWRLVAARAAMLLHR